MQRTQISLTVEQAARLKKAAAASGVSMSHVIREAIDAYVTEPRDRPTVIGRAKAAAGRFASDRSEVSELHDDYLAEDPRGW